MSGLPLVAMLLAVPLGAANHAWPFWETYAQTFIDDQGRVVEHDEEGKTTSEAQSYAMFFALVANDRARFDKLLEWTENNLSQGDITAQLPAWNWGKNPAGQWSVLDKTSAADADLWIAYTLFEAAAYWNEPRYEEKARRLASLIEIQEVADLPGFGRMLLPGSYGFQLEGKTFVLNPSYLPLPVVAGLASHLPRGPWKDVAERVPRLVQKSSPHGVALDWVTYSKPGGFVPQDARQKESLASYDAIRVYLWAGIADPNTPGRRALLSALSGMTRALERNVFPPAVMSARGEVISQRAGPGYSAALIPFLQAVGHRRLEKEQKSRWSANYSEGRLIGDPPRYYEQNLALFATGWLDGRYKFDRTGKLILQWSKP